MAFSCQLVSAGAGFLLGGGALIAHASAAPELHLPIDCALGKTCFVQNYVDVDPTARAQDYACGAQTYDGHKGTDIRILDDRMMAQGVAVLAAAAGRVRAVRDNMPDRRAKPDDPEIKDRECGNGLVIDHGDGWQTQYCHMKRGSISVKTGDRMSAGQRIGAVGLSGLTQFPHIHLSLRHNNKIIDPFYGTQLKKPACAQVSTGDPVPLPAGSLWAPRTAQALTYRPFSAITMGFSGGPVSAPQIDSATLTPLTPTSEALVFYIRLLHLQKGDTQRATITGPKGTVLLDAQAEPPDRAKAQAHYFWGKRRKAKRWPAGTYTVKYHLIRRGKTLLSLERTFSMPR